jgi:aryl-alcohol dehydrogenase-like predicted oxidoreductase
MRIALGTAQFGLDYGISNKLGRINIKEVEKIIITANNNNLNTIDTAAVYGDSEKILGEIGVCNFDVITKLPSIPFDEKHIASWVRDSVHKSLERLNINSLHGVFFHNPKDLFGKHRKELYNSLVLLKKEGLVNKIGVSIYDPSELNKLLSRYNFDIVQMPFNIIDRRLITTGWLNKLDKLNVEIHARSIFLQGLLLMRDRRPKKFSKWDGLWSIWDAWLVKYNLTPLQACLGYVLSFPEISKFIVGVNSDSHLRSIIDSYDNNISSFPKELHSNDVDLLNPSNWCQL